MISLKIKDRDAKRVHKFLSKMDRRISAFYRGIATHAARLCAMGINQKIDPNKDPLSKEYKDGVRSLWIKDAEKIPKEEIGKVKPMTNVEEQHWACIAVRAMTKTGEELEREGDVVIKIVPPTRKMKKMPSYIFYLVRYGPWTPELIPYFPTMKEATVLYVKVSRDELNRVRRKNERVYSKIRNILRKYGISTRNKQSGKLGKDVLAIEDLEYYILRRELGVLVGSKKAWKPTIKDLKRKGVRYLIKTNKQLWRALFDPSYSGYGMLGRFTTIDKGDVETFEDFIKKLKI